MLAKAPRISLCLAILMGSGSLTGCGGGGSGSAAPTPPPGSHTLEAVPFGQLGAGKVVFNRADMVGRGWRDGIYMIDPVSNTSSFEFGAGAGWYPSGPQVSPDGLSVAYARWTDANTLFDVYVANLNGSAARQVSAFPGQDGPPSWTPDGLQIAYYASAQIGSENFYRQPPVMPTGAQRVQITNFPPTATSCPVIAEYTDRVSISISGQIVWICAASIELTAPDGSLTTAIYTLAASTPPYTELHAATWSPDGLHIAFLELFRAAYTAGPGPGERKQMVLNVVDALGQNPTVLATVASSGLQDLGGEDNINSLCWAADGSRIFFNVPDGTDGNEQAHLWAVNADGSGLIQVTHAAGVWDHSVSCSR